MLLIRRQSLFAALAAGCVLLGLASTVGAQEKIYRPELSAQFLDSSLRTDWFGVYVQNKKIGYFRRECQRKDGTFVETQFTSMKLVSFDQKVEITQTQTLVFQDKTPYRLLKGTLVEKKGAHAETTTVTWNEPARGYDSVYEVAGEKRKELLKDIDYTLADDSGAEFWITQRPKVGDVIVTRAFDLGERKIDVQTCKVLSRKQGLAGGIQVHFYEIESESKLRQIKSISRYDEQGMPLSTSLAIFEMRKETEAQAKNTQYSQDLFVMGRVKIDRALGRESKVAGLVVAVDGIEPDLLEDGPRQRVLTGGKGTVLKLGKTHGKQVKATADDIKEALTETNGYPFTHPKIKALAEQAVAGARTDEEKVAKLVAFVYRFVQPRMSPNAPIIFELLEKKQGDCKAYALLFTNLARAAGIPTREISGLVYAGDDVQAFDGHAWNEVVLNGVWVPVDASRGETEINATHISFGTEHRATRTLLSSLGKLSFRMVEVDNGK